MLMAMPRPLQTSLPASPFSSSRLKVIVLLCTQESEGPISIRALWKCYQYFFLSFRLTWGEIGQTVVLGPESYYKTKTPPRNLSQLKNEALGINQAKNIHPLLSRIPNDTGHWKPIPLIQRENSSLLEMSLMPSISVKTQKSPSKTVTFYSKACFCLVVSCKTL